MNKGNYIISVKKVKEYMGAVIPEDKQYFQYAGLDIHSGAMSSGYPCFVGENHALRFDTEGEAQAWWDKNKDAICRAENINRYDLNTLAIRKVSYRKITSLAV